MNKIETNTDDLLSKVEVIAEAFQKLNDAAKTVWL